LFVLPLEEKEKERVVGREGEKGRERDREIEREKNTRMIFSPPLLIKQRLVTENKVVKSFRTASANFHLPSSRS